MAEKVIQKEQPDDATILLPHRDINIAGETITVREYSFKDALTIGSEIEQFTARIVTAMNESNKLTIEQADALIIDNLALVNALISVSINKPISFIESLSYTDGLQLLDWWVGGQFRFFMNAVTRKIIRQNAIKQAKP
ncbi:hypothetical protein PT273_08770 [Orbaceae bacterium ESL0727]|nr:hypothetical protein [Orbaceae bacterium ESL0727]